MRAKNPLLAGLAVVLVAAAVAALVAILTGDFFEDEINSQLFGCALVVAFAYVVVAPALVLLFDQRRERGLAMATLVLAALGVVLGVITVFSEFDEGAGTLSKLAGTLLVAAAVAGQASAEAHRRRAHEPGESRILAAAAVALGAVAGLLIVIAIWGESDDTTLYRAIGGTLVVSLLLHALAQIPRRMAAPASGRVDAEDAALEADRVHAPERVLPERDEPRDAQR